MAQYTAADPDAMVGGTLVRFCVLPLNLTPKAELVGLAVESPFVKLKLCTRSNQLDTVIVTGMSEATHHTSSPENDDGVCAEDVVPCVIDRSKKM